MSSHSASEEHTDSPDVPSEVPAGSVIGIVGVGEIGAAIVEALLTGQHADSLEFVLSPRSAHRSAALADRYEQCRVADTNQNVVDAADVVMLAVLPQHIETVCGELDFRAEHTVVGIAAGWAPSQLGPLVTPAGEVCQLVPLPMITLHAGPMTLYPRIAAVETLFADCGTIVVPESEHQVPVLSCASATMSTFFAVQHGVIRWMTSQGFDVASAKQFVTSMFSGLSAEGMTADDADLARLIPAHETPGGLNQQLRETLESDGVFEALSSGLDGLMARLHDPAR